MKNNLPPFSEAAKNLKPGIYEHFKPEHHKYRVLGVGRNSETLEEEVIYQALYGEKNIWIRPLQMFLEEAEIDGEKVPRFKYIGE
ncbi:DUF1653 domain-containing protein [Patescibacteria group bacterium]|nr:DUF1653 domain-containing protein [Patescibacteria group bacterium]